MISILFALLFLSLRYGHIGLTAPEAKLLAFTTHANVYNFGAINLEGDLAAKGQVILFSDVQ